LESQFQPSKRQKSLSNAPGSENAMPREKALPTAKPDKRKKKERCHAGESRLREWSVNGRCG